MTAYICKRTQYITDLKHECNLFTIITILRTCKKKLYRGQGSQYPYNIPISALLKTCRPMSSILLAGTQTLDMKNTF